MCMGNDYFRPSGAKPLDRTPSQAAHEAARARAAASAGAAPSVGAVEAGASAACAMPDTAGPPPPPAAPPSSSALMPTLEAILPARASSAPVHWQQQQRGCETFDFRLQLQQGIPVQLHAPPYRETARLETIVDPNGLSNVGAQLHAEMVKAGGQLRRIATMVAGNSGRPAGACGFEDGTLSKLHAGHTTQEEDVVSNWMTTACHNAGKPLMAGGHYPNAIYQDTIFRKWGMLHPQASDKKTVQHVDYTRAHGSSYGHAWVVGNAALSAKETDSYGQRFYNVHDQYPTSLVFVAGPNCGARGHDARSTMTRTFNPHAEADYRLFRSGVQAALYAGLMAMARLGIEVALLAHVSAGIYAGPHRAMLHADFVDIVNELLEREVCNSPSGPAPLGRYFHRVILTLLE